MDMARICAVNGICRDRVITCRGLICKDLSIQVSRRMMGIKRRKDLFVRECLIGRAKQGTGSTPPVILLYDISDPLIRSSAMHLLFVESRPFTRRTVGSPPPMPKRHPILPSLPLISQFPLQDVLSCSRQRTIHNIR